jgi:hypothetical protein
MSGEWEAFREKITEAAKRRDATWRAAELVVRQMPREALHGLLVKLTQLEIEKARSLEELLRPEREPKPRRDYDTIFCDIWDSPGLLTTRAAPRLNSTERLKFRRWCKAEGHDFDGWLDKLLTAAPEKLAEGLKINWIPGYKTPSEEERERDFFKTTLGYIEEYAQSVRLEVTAELLGTEFPLPDGRLVTWAEATVDDHELRADDLVEMAAGAFGGAALHRRAIEMLQRHGAKTLGDLEPEAMAS